jgi:hypothetical protein
MTGGGGYPLFPPPLFPRSYIYATAGLASLFWDVHCYCAHEAREKSVPNRVCQMGAASRSEKKHVMSLLSYVCMLKPVPRPMRVWFRMPYTSRSRTADSAKEGRCLVSKATSVQRRSEKSSDEGFIYVWGLSRQKRRIQHVAASHPTVGVRFSKRQNQESAARRKEALCITPIFSVRSVIT